MMKKPTKSDIIRTVNQSKSIDVFEFNKMTDKALALKILNDAVKNESTVVVLK